MLHTFFKFTSGVGNAPSTVGSGQVHQTSHLKITKTKEKRYNPTTIISCKILRFLYIFLFIFSFLSLVLTFSSLPIMDPWVGGYTFIFFERKFSKKDLARKKYRVKASISLSISNMYTYLRPGIGMPCYHHNLVYM